jgi:hypothetical protein
MIKDDVATLALRREAVAPQPLTPLPIVPVP